MLGVPGARKSDFARNLAEKHDMLRITATEFVDRSPEAIEPPQDDELSVKIDRQLDFDDQYRAFPQFFEKNK